MKTNPNTSSEAQSNFWRKLISTGIKEGLSESEKRKIRLLNSILMIGEAIFILLVFKSWSQNIYEEWTVQLLGVILFFIPLIFNFTGKYITARYLCVIVPYLYLSFLGYYWGSDRGSQLIIFGAAALSILFFENRNTTNTLFIIGIAILLITYVLNIDHTPIYQSPGNETKVLINLFITSIMIYFAVNIFKNENDRYQTNLIEKNESILSNLELAKSVHDSLLKNDEGIKQTFNEAYTYSKNNEAIGGYFHWHTKVDDKHVIVIADTSISGVGGSLISVLLAYFLSDVVSKSKITLPSRILMEINNKLNAQLVLDKFNFEGVRMGVIEYRPSLSKVRFAGAVQSLFVANSSKTNCINGTHIFLSKERIESDFKFYTHEVDLKYDDMIYLVSKNLVRQISDLKDRMMHFTNLPTDDQTNKWEDIIDQNEVTGDSLVLAIRHKG